MGVVGGVLAHRMVGIQGWKDVQLLTFLLSTLTDNLGRQEVVGAVRFLPAGGLWSGLGIEHLPGQ